MTERDQQVLEDTLNELAEKKHDFISEEALEAKIKFDEVKDELETQDLSFDDEDDFNRSTIDIDSFNDNVKLLMAVFKKSKFEEFIYLLGKPNRLYVIQLLMGFFKGAGFVLGALFVLMIIAYSFGEATISALLN